MCEIGLSFLIDLVALNLPNITSPSTILYDFRFDAILGIFGLSATTYGFLHSQANTPLYTERLIIYNFIFGIGVANYYLYPGLSVEWIAGIGWQYATLPFDLMIIDLLVFIPIIELLIHGIRRLRFPFRFPHSRHTVIVFFVGLLVIIISNVISYFTDLLYYLGLAVGLGLMGAGVFRNPLVLNITHVKIYDLVVSVNAVAVARYNFERKEAIRSEHLLSGAFSGINTLTGETISTKKELTLLQTEDKTVLMHKSKDSKIFLVTDRLDDICRVAMKRLGRFVDDYYHKRNEIFNVEIDAALFAQEIRKIFTFA